MNAAEDGSGLPGPGLKAAARLLGRPWTLLILATLAGQPRRFTQIVGQLPGISTNLLSERLRVLDRAGLIERQDDEIAHYRLTSRGRAVVPVLVSLDSWGATLDPDQSAT